MAHSPEPVDFVVLTALPEELDAVLEVFGRGSFRPDQTPGSKLSPFRIEIPSATPGTDHVVVAMSCLGYGPSKTTAVMGSIFRSYLPFFILVVGTGGGIHPREGINLGDAALSNQVVPYDLGKQIRLGKRTPAWLRSLFGWLIPELNTSGVTKSPRPQAIQQPGYYLQQKCIVAEKSAWRKRVKIVRPDGNADKQPEVRSGGFLSGSIVWSDYTSPEFKVLLETNPKALLVEMESAGVGEFLYVSSPQQRVEYLGIRGISDFPNTAGAETQRPLWSPYARQVAAAFAYALILNTEKQSFDVEVLKRYLEWFADAIREIPLPDQEFNVTVSFAKTFASLVAGAFTKAGLPSESLMGSAVEIGRIVLHGEGGAGKSVILRRLAERALKTGHIPVFLNLRKLERVQEKAWFELNQGNASSAKKLDYLLGVCGIADLTVEAMSTFPPYVPKILIVDGLDRVPSNRMATEILDSLDDYVRRTMRGACVIVSDRMTDRISLHESKWTFAVVDRLKEDDIQLKITGFATLPQVDKELLRLPFFLQLALRNKSGRFGSKPEAFRSYFRDQLGIDEEGLKILSKAAFDIYRTSKSSMFSASGLAHAVGDENFHHLESSGALLLKGQDSAEFFHDLLHDFLAARYVAESRKLDDRVPDLWNGESFDALTFEANSFDALVLTLNQIQEITGRDEFLKAVYNWNVYATVQCMAEALRSRSTEAFTSELEMALLALVAEKLFDHVIPTRNRIKSVLTEFPSDTAQKFVSAKSLNEVIALVLNHGSQVPWFLEWRRLYTMQPETKPSREDLLIIESSDSILGWTTSNVLRRTKLDDSDIEFLRRLFQNSAAGHTVRWRIVHTLGAFPTPENSDLLLTALSTDQNGWVRYGAVRALVEIAAGTKDEGLRTNVLDRLSEGIGGMRDSVLAELGRAVFLDAPPPSWGDKIASLLRNAIDIQRTEKGKEAWKETLDRFTNYWDNWRKG